MRMLSLSAKFRRHCTTVIESVDERPLVGSSRKRMGGMLAKDFAMLTRLFWPPEIPLRVSVPMKVSAAASNCICFRRISTRWCPSSEVIFVFFSMT
mmetsp:Transcript_11454/g.47662  ORF Transcript_11454/g.47662 Transcript_11454/m.47662 type:complete len:96 (-) Transcript_11454:739-1026(-)